MAGGSRCSIRACRSASRCSFCACLSDCWCGGPGAETAKERTPEWDECPVVGCASPRRGRRKLVAPGVYERAREAHTGSFFAGSPSPGRAGRATAFIKPCSWQALFDRSHVRLVVVCNDGSWLSYKGLPRGWLARCSRRGYGDNWQGPTRSTRRVPRRDPLYAASIAVVSRTRAAAATKAYDRRRDHHRQRSRRVVGLAAPSAARTQLARMGHPWLRCCDGNPVPFGGAPGGALCYQRRPLEQCRPSWSTEAAAAGAPDCGRGSGVPEEGPQVRRQFRSGADGLQQPASRPVGGYGSGAPRRRLGSGRGRILEVHSSLHGCSCAKASRQEACEKIEPSRR